MVCKRSHLSLGGYLRVLDPTGIPTCKRAHFSTATVYLRNLAAPQVVEEHRSALNLYDTFSRHLVSNRAMKGPSRSRLSFQPRLLKWLRSMKESVSSSLQPSPLPVKRTPSLQEEILEACSGKDVANLRRLLEAWHSLLLKQAGGSGGVNVVQQLLDQYGITEAQKQLLLSEAAVKGNSDVFRFLLQQWPDYPIDDHLRACAFDGGVEIWNAIHEHNPKLIHYSFGHIGDAISMAAIANNIPLLAFFLEKGLNPNESHFCFKPIFIVATREKGINKETIDLLVKHGATVEKSLAAYRSMWGKELNV